MTLSKEQQKLYDLFKSDGRIVAEPSTGPFDDFSDFNSSTEGLLGRMVSFTMPSVEEIKFGIHGHMATVAGRQRGFEIEVLFHPMYLAKIEQLSSSMRKFQATTKKYTFFGCFITRYEMMLGGELYVTIAPDYYVAD